MTELAPGDLFTGNLVRLTAPREEDKADLARWSNDSVYLRLLDDDPARPRPADFFKLPDKEDERRGFEFRIRTLAEDKLIGFVALFAISWNNQSALLGIGIGEPAYRGKGCGTDALRLILGYAFRELGLHRVGLQVVAYNAPALRAYEKVGFVREGVTREAIFRDGKHFDLIHMGVLRADWINPWQARAE